MLLLGSCNKESQMSELGDSKARAQKRWPVASIAAGLLAAAVLCQPDLAHAAHGGGGGFHGGGFLPRGAAGRGSGGVFRRRGDEPEAVGRDGLGGASAR